MTTWDLVSVKKVDTCSSVGFNVYVELDKTIGLCPLPTSKPIFYIICENVTVKFENALFFRLMNDTQKSIASRIKESLEKELK